MTFDASNRKQVRAKQKESSLAERNRIAYIKRIMSDQTGREWMQSLLESCALFGSAFVRSSPDATAYNLGRQDVGKQIFADVVVHCPTEYFLMMQEANVKEITNERRNSDDRSPASGEQPGSTEPGRELEGPEPGDYNPYAREAEA